MCWDAVGTRSLIASPLNRLISHRLAHAELYITLGTFFRRFSNLRIYKTTEWDMEYTDAIVSRARDGVSN